MYTRRRARTFLRSIEEFGVLRDQSRDFYLVYGTTCGLFFDWRSCAQVREFVFSEFLEGPSDLMRERLKVFTSKGRIGIEVSKYSPAFNFIITFPLKFAISRFFNNRASIEAKERGG